MASGSFVRPWVHSDPSPAAQSFSTSSRHGNVCRRSRRSGFTNWSRCGSFRLWQRTQNHRLRALFADDCDPQGIGAYWRRLSVFRGSVKPTSRGPCLERECYGIFTQCAFGASLGSGRASLGSDRIRRRCRSNGSGAGLGGNSSTTALCLDWLDRHMLPLTRH